MASNSTRSKARRKSRKQRKMQSIFDSFVVTLDKLKLDEMDPRYNMISIAVWSDRREKMLDYIP